MKRMHIFQLASALIVLALTTGCTQQSSQTKAPDRGDFKVLFEPAKEPDHAALRRILRESRVFEEIAQSLNGELALPHDLPIFFSECGEVNAYYDPEAKHIRVCYELVSSLAQEFSQLSLSEEDVDRATWQTTFFVLYHELGHALIDILNLPATGKEEDAADQLATLVLIASGDEGEDAALKAASWFLVQGLQKTDIEELPFWDEHSLDLQRFYNIVCWIYGRNPDRHEDLVKEGYLPEERAERCEGDYQKVAASWSSLLSPHQKP